MRSAHAPLGNLAKEIADLERLRMKEAMQAAGGVGVRAAALIGMPLRTFATKLKAHRLMEASREAIDTA